jgi:hypothetical protein
MKDKFKSKDELKNKQIEIEGMEFDDKIDEDK